MNRSVLLRVLLLFAVSVAFSSGDVASPRKVCAVDNIHSILRCRRWNEGEKGERSASEGANHNVHQKLGFQSLSFKTAAAHKLPCTNRRIYVAPAFRSIEHPVRMTRESDSNQLVSLASVSMLVSAGI